MNTRIGVLCVVLGFTIVEAACAQQRVEHNRPKFSLRVPPGFTSKPATPPFLYEFEKRVSSDKRTGGAGNEWTVIRIAAVESVVAPRKLTVDDVKHLFPPGSRLHVTPPYMRYEHVNMAIVNCTGQGVSVSHRVAEIPLADGTVHLVVGGEVGHAYADPRDVYMKSMLMSFQGTLLADSQGPPAPAKRVAPGEQILRMVGGGFYVLGFVALLGYGVYRLCLIGRASQFIRSRRMWLAISGTMIFLGAVSMGMTITIYHRFEQALGVLVGLLIGLTVLFVRSWIKPPKASVLAPPPDGIPLARVPEPIRMGDSPQDVTAGR